MKMLIWGPFHERFFHRTSNPMKFSVCSNPNCREVIPMDFCTWHDGCTVVAHAKFCSDAVPYSGATLNKNPSNLNYDRKIGLDVGLLFHASLTHWGRVTHICVVKLTIIGSDNGLSPGRRQSIIWTNAGILLTGPLGTNFSEILIGIQTFSFTKIHLKMSSAKWRPFFLGLNVLIRLEGWEQGVQGVPQITLYSLHHLI